MHNVIWMGTWRVVVIDGVNIGSFLQHVGSYVLAYVHTCMHTYMHLGSWIFCVGSYLYSSIGSSNVPFVRSHFGFDKVA